MSSKYTVGSPTKFIETAFDSSTEKTPVVDLQGETIVGLKSMDANLVATAITFETSDEEGGTFTTERADDGTIYTVTMATSQKVHIQPAKTAGFSNFVKLVSNGDETTAARIRIYTKAAS